jgi:hypothetical protein
MKEKNTSSQGWREIGEKRCYFRSRWEANYARYLEFMCRKGQFKDWQHEPKTFWFEAIKRGVRSYLPDFCVFTNEGKHEWHEVKGYMDPKSKTKIARFAKYYPQETLKVISSSWFKNYNSTMRSLIVEWE